MPDLYLKIPHPRGRIRDGIARERFDAESIGPCDWTPGEATVLELTRAQAEEVWRWLGVQLLGLRIEVEGVRPTTTREGVMG